MSLTNKDFFYIFEKELETMYTHEKTINLIFKFYKEHLIKLSFISVPGVFKTWNEINTSSCYYLLILSYHAIEKNETKYAGIDIYPEMIDKKIMKNIYTNIYNNYHCWCMYNQLSFVPCLKGLETILKKKI